MSYQYVNVVTINKVAVIEFNYGRKLNALSKVFIDDLMQALSDLNRPEIRCIILRAPSGSKVFSAGHDIHELPSGGRDPLSYDDPLRQITRMIQKFPKPIISMVEGSVWGGAFEMIMSSDLIIAASTSTFSMTPVNLGVPYNLVGIQPLEWNTPSLINVLISMCTEIVTLCLEQSCLPNNGMAVIIRASAATLVGRLRKLR